MDEISVSQLKANPAKVLKRAQKSKLPIRLTHRGKPIAEITVSKPVIAVDRDKLIGSKRNSMKILGDIISPVICVD
jgi:prevent-host-death family protein